MHGVSSARAMQTFYDGWANYQRLLLTAIRELTPEQFALRPAPRLWAVWKLAGHMAGSRAYWFHDVLGQGDPATRDMFRVNSTTVPDLPLEDALQAFETGVGLVRTLNERLSAVERRIEVLTRGADGRLRLQPQDEDAE